MTFSPLTSGRRRLVVAAALTVFGLTALTDRATAAVDGGSVAASSPDEALLDHFFHPVGLFLAPAFFPPPSDPGAPPPSKEPGDPNIVLRINLPQAVPPPPGDGELGNPPGNPPGGGNPGGGTKGPPVNSPEPATFVSSMLGAGLLSWFGWRRRRKEEARQSAA